MTRTLATCSSVSNDGVRNGVRHDVLTDNGRATRERLLRARVDFVVEASAITAEVRQLLSADQIDLLSDGLQRLLNPRLWQFLALQDAGDI